MRSSVAVTIGLASVVLGLEHYSRPANSYVTTKDNVQIWYKDWGNATGQPVVFSHGWPLDGDAFDNQAFYLAQRGYRVIAHDRRGHGRSSQPSQGNDMDTYADDLSLVFEKLDLKNATMVGHSTGGGEVVRYLGRYGTSRVSKAVLVSAVTPFLEQTPNNTAGVPKSVFDGLRTGYLSGRANFWLGFASGPFFGYNNTNVNQGNVMEFMSQGLQSGFINAYECIKALSETDFRGDMRKLDIPVMVIHGSGDQVVPISASALQSIKLLKNGTLKIYPGGAHALPQTATQELNEDLLAFIRK